MQKLIKTLLTLGLGTTLLTPLSASASSKPLDNLKKNGLGIGTTVQLKQPTKVSFVQISYGKTGVVSKVKAIKVLPKGTYLSGFRKGTEGVFDCFYNFKAGVPITKNVWPSVELTNANAKIVHRYHYKYGYEYTIKKVLHEKY